MNIKITKLTNVDLLRKANSFTTGKESGMSLKTAQAGMSVHENFRKVLTLWYENLRSVLAVPSGRIGRAV